MAGRRERIEALGYAPARQPARRREDCNLCGGQRFVRLCERDRYGYPVGADGCLRCGLVFLQPVMTRDAYARFYRDVYRPLVSAYHGRRIDAETLQAEQHDYAAALCETLAPHLEAGAQGGRTLLDVGGSTGVVARALARRFGLRATLLDPAPLEVAVARRLGLDTEVGFAEDFDPAGRRFDVITLCQTIDHLLDVRATLATLRRAIADRGRLFVDIVDFRAAWRRQASVREAIKLDHPFSLTEATARAYLGRAGFRVVRAERAADGLHVGFVCAPAEPEPDALPSSARVAAQWRELAVLPDGAGAARAAAAHPFRSS